MVRDRFQVAARASGIGVDGFPMEVAGGVLEASLVVREEGGGLETYPVEIDAGRGIIWIDVPLLAETLQVRVVYGDGTVRWSPTIEVVESIDPSPPAGEAARRTPDVQEEEGPDPREEYRRRIRFEVMAAVSRAVGAGGEAKPCRGCGRQIFWFPTVNGKKQPFDPDENVSHWGTCPEAGRFRRGSKR